MIKVFTTILFCAVCWGCANIEDATPSKRKTFIRFYESAISEFGVSAEAHNNGFVLVSYEIKNQIHNTIIRITDASGNERTSERIVIPHFKANALKISSDAYYLAGDQIELNPSSENLFDLRVTSAVLKKATFDGNVSTYIARDSGLSNLTDLQGSAVTIDPSGNIVLVGSFQHATAQAQIKPFVTVLDPVSLDTVWTKPYESMTRDFINGKSAHIAKNGNIIWVSSLLKEAGDLSNTILSIANVSPGSSFTNNDRFGESSDQQLSANDIQPAPLGYGVIGTHARTTGRFSNMFFLRVDHNGNIIQGSEKYFDGETLLSNSAVTADVSLSEDTGDALTYTQDGGYILAGSMLTTVNRGKGGLDILLVKVDAFGNIVWNKILGSEGDETINSVRETADGHLVLCGSNNLAGHSSAFIIKTDKNGELKN